MSHPDASFEALSGKPGGRDTLHVNVDNAVADLRT